MPAYGCMYVYLHYVVGGSTDLRVSKQLFTDNALVIVPIHTISICQLPIVSYTSTRGGFGNCQPTRLTNPICKLVICRTYIHTD